MQILWLKRTSLGVIIINLIMAWGYFLLTVCHLSLPAPYRQKEEKKPVLQQPDFPIFIPSFGESRTKRPSYDRLIRDACRKHSIDPALVKAVILAESGFDPWAVSPKGAMGLMQLSPIVTRALGITDPFNPKLNINGGVRYLKDLLNTFNGDQELALAAYNAGPSQVHRHNGVPPFKDTKKYLSQVFRYIYYYQKPPIS